MDKNIQHVSLSNSTLGNSHGTHWIGEFVEPRFCSEGVDKEKNFWRIWEKDYNSSIILPIVMIETSLSMIQVFGYNKF
jgi:hypothetical protein